MGFAMKKIIAIMVKNTDYEYYYVDGFNYMTGSFKDACRKAVETESEYLEIDGIDDADQRITESEAIKRGYIQ